MKRFFCDKCNMEVKEEDLDWSYIPNLEGNCSPKRDLCPECKAIYSGIHYYYAMTDLEDEISRHKVEQIRISRAIEESERDFFYDKGGK